MRNTLLVLFVLIPLASSTGCYRHVITLGEGGNTERGAPDAERTEYYFLDGLVGQSSVNVKSVCHGSPNATVVVEQSLLNGVIGNCLCGKWVMPQTVKVYCGRQDARASWMAPAHEGIAARY